MWVFLIAGVGVGGGGGERTQSPVSFFPTAIHGGARPKTASVMKHEWAFKGIQREPSLPDDVPVMFQ